MVDSKSIMEKLEELWLLMHKIIDEGMSICETFQVNCFIEKFFPCLKDFKNYLKHKQKIIMLKLVNKKRTYLIPKHLAATSKN